MLYQNSSKCKEGSALLRKDLSRAISRVFNFSSKSLLSLVEMEKTSKHGE